MCLICNYATAHEKYIPQYSQIYSQHSGKETTQYLTRDIKPSQSHC